MPELRIEVGPHGISRVKIRYDADRPYQGLNLLTLALPALTDLHGRLQGIQPKEDCPPCGDAASRAAV
jgi:hypothetical protein